MYNNSVWSVEYLRSLPGIYAWIDYVASFHGKEKIRLMKIMKRHEKFVKAFKILAKQELMQQTVSLMEEFVCNVYGYKYSSGSGSSFSRSFSVSFWSKMQIKETWNTSRFNKEHGPKTFSSMPNILKCVNSALFITNLNKTATSAYPAVVFAEIVFGWKLSDDKESLDIKWFDGG